MQSNDLNLKSFIDIAGDCHFPIQNLPFGIFTTGSAPERRVGVAIGEQVLDLASLEEAGLLRIAPAGERVFNRPSLNAFIALGRLAWSRARAQVSELLRHDNPSLRDNPVLRTRVLTPMRDAKLHLPIEIPGYTDFYSSKEHATNVGSLFRDPRNALPPSWLHMPIGYNGRASSVVVSGTSIRRPSGQIKPPDTEAPVFAPCRKLDFELETAFIVGEGNEQGDPVQVGKAESHIFGMVLLNDWSARDIQQWEYVPLGPFNGKTFATSISPWVIMLEALQPFRVESPVQDPRPLPYLQQSGRNAYDIYLEVCLRPAGTVKASTICRSNFRYLYWTMAQQLAHHTISGCNTRVGDLMGSGTISGLAPDSCGSLLELTRNGQKPLALAAGVERTFLEDGDEVLMTGWCQGKGYRIGFGDVNGIILPASATGRRE